MMLLDTLHALTDKVGAMCLCEVNSASLPKFNRNLRHHPHYFVSRFDLELESVEITDKKKLMLFREYVRMDNVD